MTPLPCPRLTLILLTLAVSAAPRARAAEGVATALTLEQIMSDPDWIGQAPEQPFISADSRHAYYQRKEKGSELRALWRVPLVGGAPEKLAPTDRAAAESAERIFTPDGTRAAWLQRGNVFYTDRLQPRQLTRTGDATALLTFIGTDRVAFRAGKRLLAVELASGLVSLVATLESIADPDEPEKKELLGQQEERLFDVVRLREERRRARVENDRELSRQPAGSPRPLYFGKNKEVRTVSLSPDGRTLLVGLIAADLRGRREHVASFVNADGYTKSEDARTDVGTDKPREESLFLIDLATGKRRPVVLTQLAGLNDDPLSDLRRAATARKKAEAAQGKSPKDAEVTKSSAADEKPAVVSAEKDQKPKARAVAVLGTGDSGVRWSTTGRLAIMLLAYDNKDRWLAEVKLADAQVHAWHRLTDTAWINRTRFNEFDWTSDGAALWFTSEENGYSQLYLARADGIHPLTSGQFEVSSVQPTHDGRWLYYRANATRPGNHEVFRVKLDGTGGEAVTSLGGDNTFDLSADGAQVLVVHSTTTHPAELYVQPSSPSAPARVLTDCVTPEFVNLPQIAPEMIAIPSRAGPPIYSRLYRGPSAAAGSHPAVMFVHGAGYLQNSHEGWSSSYFHEHLFHQLLIRRGYIVLDLDYRGSAGYGRAWRTAIYRQMGTPELEDYLDGIEWLAKNAWVDRARIGIYGGSYGGFLTLMALFKTPDTFAAGAALRPVTDWTHYNHSYTADILNTPDLDPEAYARSSPIEFATGLKHPLLICHGMLDDNVFFQDSVRLVQRLIELKKDTFETAIFPVERHAFTEPNSWLDEYRRIFRLFEREVARR
ncbi:MAG: S9 family peptidase [Opitutus sp.]|nr:S9 family peptidase [Opitutus sp.]